MISLFKGLDGDDRLVVEKGDIKPLQRALSDLWLHGRSYADFLAPLTEPQQQLASLETFQMVTNVGIETLVTNSPEAAPIFHKLVARLDFPQKEEFTDLLQECEDIIRDCKTSGDKPSDYDWSDWDESFCVLFPKVEAAVVAHVVQNSGSF